MLNELLLESVEMALTAKGIMGIIDSLKENERRVLLLRYGFTKPGEPTLEAVGNELNVTRERIRQIEAKALEKIRKKLGIKENSQKHE